MEIYLVSFFSSFMFYYFYEKNNNKTIKRVCIFIAVLIPCLLAGMRDISVGVDTSGYVKTLFDTANQSGNIFDYYNSTFYYEWHNQPVSSFDLGYTILAYFTSSIFRTFSSFLFFSEVLTLVPIVAALVLYKRYFNISISFSMLMFYFLYYNTTYNAVRQWISIGFAFLAIAHLCTDKNKRKIIVYALISTLFHKSGLLVVLLIVFYLIINNVRAKNVILGSILLKKDEIKIIGIIAISLILLFSLTTVIVPILSGIGLGRYVGYINGHINFSVNQLLYQIPFLLVILMEKRSLFAENNGDILSLKRFKLFSVCVCVLNAILSQLATIMENSWRVMLIFGVFNTVLFSYIYKNEVNMIKRIAILVLLIGYVIIYWFFMFVITQRHGTVPYILA